MDSGNISERKSGSKKRIYNRIGPFAAAFFFFFLISIQPAATDPDEEKTNLQGSAVAEASDPFSRLSDDRIKILESAYSFLGKKTESTVSVRNESICLDCIGTVIAVYLDAGFDFRDKMSGGYDSGVRNLYAFLKENNAVYTEGLPVPGDIVFWDNTWDADGDGDNTNDPLTHAGIVIKVEENGTVHYLHAHITRGIIIQKMNRYTPEYYSESGEVINDAMALGSGISRDNNPEKWTSGDLWSSYGSILDAISNHE